jgi:hypothetical protein
MENGVLKFSITIDFTDEAKDILKKYPDFQMNDFWKENKDECVKIIEEEVNYTLLPEFFRENNYQTQNFPKIEIINSYCGSLTIDFKWDISTLSDIVAIVQCVRFAAGILKKRIAPYINTRIKALFKKSNANQNILLPEQIIKTENGYSHNTVEITISKNSLLVKGFDKDSIRNLRICMTINNITCFIKLENDNGNN